MTRKKKKKDKGEKTQPNLQSQRRQKRVLTDRRLKPNRDITVTEVGMFPQPEGSDASPGMKAAIGSSWGGGSGKVLPKHRKEVLVCAFQIPCTSQPGGTAYLLLYSWVSLTPQRQPCAPSHCRWWFWMLNCIPVDPQAETPFLPGWRRGSHPCLCLWTLEA